MCLILNSALYQYPVIFSIEYAKKCVFNIQLFKAHSFAIYYKEAHTNFKYFPLMSLSHPRLNGYKKVINYRRKLSFGTDVLE